VGTTLNNADNMFTSTLLTTTLLSSFLLLGGSDDSCSSSKAALASRPQNDIVQTALADKSFSTLVTALKAAGLVDTLQGDGPFTVFAPTNAAFAKLPKAEMKRLLDPKNKGLLASILTYHVAPGTVLAKDVVGMKKSEPFLLLNSAATANGQRINFTLTGGALKIGGSAIVKTDIECSNGVIHVIDTVMVPSMLDVIDTAVGAGSFKTLAAALDAAKLIETLRGAGPFTVFAPTDAAFAALPAGTVQNLLKPENRESLAAVLTYHVIPGRVYSETVAEGHDLTTLQGQVLNIRVQDKAVFVNKARIVTLDIDTTNGVIHVIDAVLLPQLPL
jgi:transforming growth factor-beta-induced protein